MHIQTRESGNEKVNGILTVLAVLFLAIGFLVSISEKYWVIFRLPENIISDFSFFIGCILLVAVCIILLVMRIKNGEKGKILVCIGILLFSLPAVSSGCFILERLPEYSLVKKFESPDGEHSLYYRENKVRRYIDDEVRDGVTIMNRTGLFTYEVQISLTDFDESKIEWGENSAKFYLKELEYSTYGD